ncbi:maleylpyruvate isomerase N-terminal domain-containing protein [Streptomyces sp. NPDC058653]|uniref:maleylpyruvate isomerase N-terminal domain-containing protein n=1 Tax=Streptomyces sp. NPDC058653 TaxID=3346576 RepID=UPI003662CB67
MSALSHDRRCAELATQTRLLRSRVEGADLTVPVPTCPGWTLGQLLRHVGGTHHWAETVVRTRATGPVPEDLVDDVSGYAAPDPDAMDAWVAEGAAGLADALRAAGPGERVWTPGPGGTTAFWARRMLFEAVVHRADATWAVGAEFEVDDDLAVDGIDEWMGFGTVPEVVEPHPGVPPLLGPGRTLHFGGPGAAPGWLVDLTGEAVVCRRADGPAPETTTTAVRGPLSDLLLLLYGRRPPKPAPVEITGDAGLLALWVERSGFWLRE